MRNLAKTIVIVIGLVIAVLLLGVVVINFPFLIMALHGD
jgi:hypothetical protein